MHLIPIIQTLCVLLAFITVTLKIDSVFDMLPDLAGYIMGRIFLIAFIALPIATLMLIWGVK